MTEREVRPRWKDWLHAGYCAFWDAIGAGGLLLRDDKSVTTWIGSHAQVAWFKAHNGRVYDWLSKGEPEYRCAQKRPGIYGDDAEFGWGVTCDKLKGHDGPHEGTASTVRWHEAALTSNSTFTAASTTVYTTTIWPPR